MRLSNFLIGATVGVAITYGVIKLGQAGASEPNMDISSDQVIRFDAFQQETVTVDELNGRKLSTWAKAHMDQDEAICIVAFPTEAVLKLFNIQDCPKALDVKTNVLQFVIGMENSELRAARLISFGSVSEKVDKLFNGNDYFILQ